jgi:hypothetical protein
MTTGEISGVSSDKHFVQDGEDFWAVASSILPSRFTSRVLSTVRIWSKTIWPFLRWNLTGIRVGYGRPLVVIGAMMTVSM